MEGRAPARRESRGRVWVGMTVTVTVDDQYRSTWSTRDGVPSYWYVVGHQERDFAYTGVFGDGAECDVVRFGSGTKPARVRPSAWPAGPPQPRCGQRTVELVEEHEGVTFRTCVDRAWAVAPDIDQLVIIVDAEDRLETVLLLAPLPIARVRGDAREAPPAAPDVPWSDAASCAALFPPLAPWDRALWRKNVGLAFEWAEPDELISLQMLEDDYETGLFVLFYANGLPATVGYRYEGLQHGMWYYHAPDGCLVEARLYALGVELARPAIARQ